MMHDSSKVFLSSVPPSHLVSLGNRQDSSEWKTRGGRQEDQREMVSSYVPYAHYLVVEETKK